MVNVFGSDIIDAYTSGTNVISIFTYGNQVWPEVISEYYVLWDSSYYSGTFNINGTTYNYEDYYPSNYFSGFSVAVPESAFQSGPFSYMQTNAREIKPYAFASCTSLNHISLPKCYKIEDNAFESCTLYGGVNLPKCTYIGANAFLNCDMIWQTTSLPKCSFIGSSAFMNCKFFSLSARNCLYIDDYAFAYGSLKQLNLPECTYIGKQAFRSNISLSIISLPQCSFIGKQAFDSCYSLSSVSLPKCEYISSYAFDHCSSLSTINLPECTYIGNGAFTSCTLTTVSIPKCSFIGGIAFESCYSLSSISLPECTYISEGAFALCNLWEIDLPKCSYIGRLAFTHNERFMYITLRYSSVCLLEHSNAFFRTRLADPSWGGLIKVPGSLVNRYKSASQWSYFKSMIISI